MIRKPNKGVNMHTQESISTFWIESVLKENNADQVFNLTYEGKFYKGCSEGEWVNDKKKNKSSGGSWPYYGWTVTANEQYKGLGAFLIEGTLLSCPSETLRYNEYDDKAYRFVVKVV